MEREVGGGIGIGNTCKSMADSCQCMAKTTTIKKKKEKEIRTGDMSWLEPYNRRNPTLNFVRTAFIQVILQLFPSFFF